MADEVKKRPSLSVLLALKGLVPLEADCCDRVLVDRSDVLIVRRIYQGNTEFYRDIKLPARSVKPYEYEENSFKWVYCKAKGKFVKVPCDDAQ